jgi:hypothetical protein
MSEQSDDNRLAARAPGSGKSQVARARGSSLLSVAEGGIPQDESPLA